MKFLLSFFLLLPIGFVHAQIDKLASSTLLNDANVQLGHTGIAIFDATSKQFIYRYNSDKYFIPASTTKLFTLYAGLKNLKDSLAGIHYYDTNDTLYTIATGDPSFLLSDFKINPVDSFFKAGNKPVVFINPYIEFEKFGKGWSWDDYEESYMPERSPFPVNGNLMKIQLDRKNSQIHSIIFPSLASARFLPSDQLNTDSSCIHRSMDDNYFIYSISKKTGQLKTELPFVTHGMRSAVEALSSLYPNRKFLLSGMKLNDAPYRQFNWKTIFSQPTDSVLKIMMHRSDNFIAEQTLLMAGMNLSDTMSDRIFIDRLLREDLSDLPQKPEWVDGSGLSRYNLFSPLDFIHVLDKMLQDVGMDRLKAILPTGGQGTLKNYFKNLSGQVFAKTGTLSNNSALCGYLYGKSGKLYLFSILINNYISGASGVRKVMENFLTQARAQL